MTPSEHALLERLVAKIKALESQLEALQTCGTCYSYSAPTENCVKPVFALQSAAISSTRPKPLAAYNDKGVPIPM